MKAVLILALIAVGLVLIGLIRIGVQVTYDPSKLVLRLKIGPIWLKLLPHREKKRPKKEKKPKEKPERSTKELLGQIRRALPVALETAGSLKRKIRLDRIYLDVAAGAEDPASAALTFGGINAALGMIWPLVEQNFKVKDRRIRTQVDFSATKTRIWLDGAATLTIGQALALALRLAPKIPQILGPDQKEQTKEKQRTDTVQKEAV